MKTLAAARFKYALGLLPEHGWDRHHFIVSVDPMRVVTVPNTLNADTGLVCLDIGSPGDVARLTIQTLLMRAKPIQQIWGEPFTVAPSPILGDETSRGAKNRRRGNMTGQRR